MNNPQPYPQPYGQQLFGHQQAGQMGIETLNISDALSIAWNHFTRQWVPWVVAALIVGILSVVPIFVMYTWVFMWLSSIDESTSSNSTYSSYDSYDRTAVEPVTNPFAMGGISIAFVAILVIGTVLGVIYGLNCYRNAFRMTQGEVIKIADFFRISGLGKPFVVQLLVGFVVLGVNVLAFGIWLVVVLGNPDSAGRILVVGLIALMVSLGSCVFGFIWMYAVFAAFANPNASIGEIFGDGFRAFKNNMGQSILLVVVCYLINLLGGALMVGTLVTGPLQMIVLAVAYRMCKQMPIVLPQGVTTSQDTHAGGYGPGAPGSQAPTMQAPGTQPWYDPTGGTQSGYSQPGYGQPGYNQAGYGQTGYGQTGYPQPGGNAQQGGQQPPNQGYGYGGQQGGNDQGGGQPGTGWQPWNQQ